MRDVCILSRVCTGHVKDGQTGVGWTSSQYLRVGFTGELFDQMRVMFCVGQCMQVHCVSVASCQHNRVSNDRPI